MTLALGLGLGFGMVDAARLTAATPATLPAIVGWGEASSVAGVDGAAVATFPNATGSGLDATQATAGFQPLIKRGVVNGQDAVLFDGVDDRLVFSGAALGWSRNVPGMTLAAVVQPTLVAGTTRRIMSVEVNASSAVRATLGSQVTPNWFASGRPADAATGKTLVPTGVALPVNGTTALLVAEFDFANGVEYLWVNGVYGGSIAYTQSSNSDNTDSFGIALGAGSDGISGFAGYLCAWSICQAPFTGTAFRRVALRWQSLYNFPLAL